MPYVLPALNVTCQQKVKTESYQDTDTQIKKIPPTGLCLYLLQISIRSSRTSNS